MGRVAFDLFQPLIHYRHGDAGTGDPVLVRYAVLRISLVCIAGAGVQLVEALYRLAGRCLFLGYLVWQPTRAGRFVRVGPGLLLVPIFRSSSGIASFAQI